MRIRYWSSDVCSSDLAILGGARRHIQPHCAARFIAPAAGQAEIRGAAAQLRQRGRALRRHSDAAREHGLAAEQVADGFILDLCGADAEAAVHTEATIAD